MHKTPEFLEIEPAIYITTWNKRYKELTELLHTNDEIRKKVVIYMYKLIKVKDLSFGERKLLDQFENYYEYLKQQNEKVIQINKKILETGIE